MKKPKPVMAWGLKRWNKILPFAYEKESEAQNIAKWINSKIVRVKIVEVTK